MRLGYEQAGPSGLAELEQLHLESNSELVNISVPHSNSH